MNGLAIMFGMDVIQALAWTILHSLWQCALIALIVALFLRQTKSTDAALRFKLSAVGLFCCVLASCFSFQFIFTPEIATSATTNALDFARLMATKSSLSWTEVLSLVISDNLELIVQLWCFGVLIYLGRHAIDLIYCQRLKTLNTFDLADSLRLRFEELAERIGIQRPPHFRLSRNVNIPCVLGLFKPIVLLPSSLLLGFNAAQVEMIVLHELAHIYRHDYLINTLQTIMKALYFFNPAVVWLSAILDQEREHACDDIAVAFSGDALLYAKTLNSFAEMKLRFTPTAAITGKNNMLKHRIHRLFDKTISAQNTGKKSRGVIAALLIASISTACAVSYYNTGEISPSNIEVTADTGVRFETKVRKDGVVLASPSVVTEFGKEVTIEISNQLKYSVIAKPLVNMRSEVSAKIYEFKDPNWKLVSERSMNAWIFFTPSFEFTTDDGTHLWIMPRATSLSQTTNKKGEGK